MLSFLVLRHLQGKRGRLNFSQLVFPDALIFFLPGLIRHTFETADCFFPSVLSLIWTIKENLIATEPWKLCWLALDFL